VARRVLFVCQANTCRSVMAHVILETMLRQRGADGRVVVRSGGVAAWARDGMLASHDARLALREVGIHLAEDAFASTDLRRHRELVAEADLILTMTGQQKQVVEALEEARGRAVFTLREFAGEAGDIDDPYGGGDDRYRFARDEIARCLARVVDHLLAP
jgi:protein-tyrosine-phosphatase